MKKTTKQSLSLMLCVLLLASSIGCSESKSNADADTNEQETQSLLNATDTETAPEEKLDERISPNLEIRDLDGYSFNIYGPHENGGGDWHVHDMIAEEYTGEAINDAIFSRNLWLENTYNFKITLEESTVEDIASEVTQFVMSGDTTYSTYAVRAFSGANLANNGKLLDLYAQQHLDFTQPYWSPSTNNPLSIKGHLYMATGDITVVTREGIRAFYFNKDLLTDYQLESPYDLVQKETWTYDKMFDMMSVATMDTNGDGIMTNKDRYGIQAQDCLGMVLYQGSGEQLIRNSDDGWTVSANGERSVEAMLRITDLISTKKSDIWISGDWKDMLNMFENNQALFYSEVMLHIVTMRGFEVDFGIIPTPKYDEQQAEYSHFVDSGCNIFYTMPVTLTNPENEAYIMEAIAAASRAEVTPAYYDICLKRKAARDQESSAMLDIIFNTYHLELGDVYGWGTLYGSVNYCLRDGANVASKLASLQKVTEKALNKSLEQFEKNNEW